MVVRDLRCLETIPLLFSTKNNTFKAGGVQMVILKLLSEKYMTGYACKANKRTGALLIYIAISYIPVTVMVLMVSLSVQTYSWKLLNATFQLWKPHMSFQVCLFTDFSPLVYLVVGF